jgi:hypothetical protein
VAENVIPVGQLLTYNPAVKAISVLINSVPAA